MTPPEGADGGDVAFGRLGAGTDPEALLGQLTFDERVAMMSGDDEFWPGLVEMLRGGYGRAPSRPGSTSTSPR